MRSHDGSAVRSGAPTAQNRADDDDYDNYGNWGDVIDSENAFEAEGIATDGISTDWYGVAESVSV